MKNKIIFLSLLSLTLLACTGTGTEIPSSLESSTEESSVIDSSVLESSSIEESSLESSSEDLSSIESSEAESSIEEISSSVIEPIYAPLSNTFLKTAAHNKALIAVTGNLKATLTYKIKFTTGGYSSTTTTTLSYQFKNFKANIGLDFSDTSSPDKIALGLECSFDLFQKTKVSSGGITLTDNSSTVPIAFNCYLTDNNIYLDLSDKNLSSFLGQIIDEDNTYYSLLNQKTCFETIFDEDTDFSTILPSLDPDSIDTSFTLIDQSICWDNVNQNNGISTYSSSMDIDDINNFFNAIKNDVTDLNEDWDNLKQDLNLPDYDPEDLDIDWSTIEIEGVDVQSIIDELSNLWSTAILDCDVSLGIGDNGIANFETDSMIKMSLTTNNKTSSDGIKIDSETTTITILPDLAFSFAYDDDATIPSPQDKESYITYNSNSDE